MTGWFSNPRQAWGGDMNKSVYDTDDNGVVDDSEALWGNDSAYHLDRANHTWTQTASTISDFSDAVWATTNTTGLVSGWELTVNVWDDSLLDVSAATYYIQWVHYTYAWDTWIANWLTWSETARRYWLDATWLVSQAWKYSDAQKQTILPIARINSVQWESWATASIQVPIDQRYFISEQGWNERLRIEHIFWALYSETWWEYSESSTLLQVNQAVWDFHDAQGKEVVVSQEDNITASYTYHTWWVPTVATEATLVVNNTQYDNWTNLTTMTDNYWKVDTLLKQSKSSNEFFVVMWNAEYATQTEAEAAAIDYSFFVNESASSLIEVARFIVRKNNTNINRIVNDIPRIKWNSNASTWVTPLLPTVSNPTELVNYEDAWRHFTSWAITNGCEITDQEDWTFNIAEWEVVIRVSDEDTSTLAVYKIAAAPWQTPADNEVTYYYIDYNSWTPVWASWTDIYSYNGTDKMQAFTIWRRWNSLFIVDATKQSVDWNRKARRRDLEWDGNIQNWFWHSRGWTVLTDSSLNPILSTGKFFYWYSPISHIGFDTTVAWTANENVFDYYYDRASYTYIADSKAINNTQYDLSWTLTSLSPNRYRTDWVYVVLNSSTPRFVVIMWDAQYTTLAVAELAPQPATLPAFMDWVWVLVWQMIAQEWTSALTTTTAFGSTFTPWASSSDHTLLSNLGWTGSWHTDWVDSIAWFDWAWAASSYTLSWTWTVLPTTTSPTFTTPALWTPSAWVATNITGLPLTTWVTWTLPITNWGTGSTTKNFVDLTTAQTVAWVKTHSSFPVTPSSAPTTDYQVANKKYVDDNVVDIPVSALADWTDWELITWASDWTSDTVAVWTADQVLTSNWVWEAPTFQDAGGGWWLSDIFEVKLTAGYNLTTSETIMPFNSETLDTGNNFNTWTYKFTAPSDWRCI